MPTHYRFGFDDYQRVPPARPRPSQDRPEEPIEGPQRRSWPFPLQDGDLLAKREDFDSDIGSGLEEDTSYTVPNRLDPVCNTTQGSVAKMLFQTIGMFYGFHGTPYL
jgi:hypothetical protein